MFVCANSNVKNLASQFHNINVGKKKHRGKNEKGGRLDYSPHGKC